MFTQAIKIDKDNVPLENQEVVEKINQEESSSDDSDPLDPNDGGSKESPKVKPFLKRVK